MPIAYDMNEDENESYIDGLYKINTNRYKTRMKFSFRILL